METRIDKELSQFMMHIIDCGVDETFSDKFQQLLDLARITYGLDVVSIIEKNGSKNIYTYRYDSVSKPEYSRKGTNMVLSDDEYRDVLHMYDESPICERIVQTAAGFGVSYNIIHYGFIRENFTISDGSICFECYGEHKWSDEERSILMKLGRLYKMLNCTTLIEGMYDSFYVKMDIERQQYRNALTDGSVYNYTMDITDGCIREPVITSAGIDLVRWLGFSTPANYDDINRAFINDHKIILTDPEMKSLFTCKGLIHSFNTGNTHPEAEYYHPEFDQYTRVSIFMYKDISNNHIHGLFVAIDVTDIKRKQAMERQVLQDAYDAANQANAAKTMFLSNMSHDIRTPMNGIIGMTTIARTYIDDKNRVEDCLGKISQASRHLLSLINDVLDMSKIESGQLELQHEPFLLTDIIDGVTAMTKSIITQKKHTLNIYLNNVEHTAVIGDSHRLEQIFINIISNAAKYTPDGGTISVSVSEKPTRIPKIWLYEFVFDDNGIGMSEEFMEKLFVPFSRAKDNRINKVQGTGLGLSITKNIIQMMNGTIKVDSRINEGSTFTVSLCLEIQNADNSRKPQYTDEIEQLREADYSGRRILLAEDNELNAETACELLSMTGLLTVKTNLQNVVMKC